MSSSPSTPPPTTSDAASPGLPQRLGMGWRLHGDGRTVAPGDVVTAVDGEPTPTPEDFLAAAGTPRAAA